MPSRAAQDFWTAVSNPVLAILDEPRDWEFLSRWVNEHRFGHSRFRQALAWLEDNHKATSFVRPTRAGRTSHVHWVKTEWLRAHQGRLES